MDAGPASGLQQAYSTRSRLARGFHDGPLARAAACCQFPLPLKTSRTGSQGPSDWQGTHIEGLAAAGCQVACDSALYSWAIVTGMRLQSIIVTVAPLSYPRCTSGAAGLDWEGPAGKACELRQLGLGARSCAASCSGGCLG